MPDDLIVIKEGKKAAFRVNYDESVVVQEEEAVFDQCREDLLYFHEGPQYRTTGSGKSGTLSGGAGQASGPNDCGSPDTIVGTQFTALNLVLMTAQSSTSTGPTNMKNALRSLGHTVTVEDDSYAGNAGVQAYDVALYHFMQFGASNIVTDLQAGTPGLIGFRETLSDGVFNSPAKNIGHTDAQYTAVDEVKGYCVQKVETASHFITQVYAANSTVEITPRGRDAAYLNAVTTAGTLILTEHPGEDGAGQPAGIALSAGSLALNAIAFQARSVSWSGLWGNTMPFSNKGAKLLDRMLRWLSLSTTPTASYTVGLVVTSTGSSGTGRIKTQLVNLNCTVTIIDETNLATHDFSSYDVVIAAVALGTQTLANNFKQYVMDIGKPVLLGPRGIFSSGASHASTFLNLTGTWDYLSTGNFGNENVVEQNTHPITDRWDDEETLSTYSGWNRMYALSSNTSHVGTALLKGDPNETTSGKFCAIAISAGSLDLTGTTVPVNTVVWGDVEMSNDPFGADGRFVLYDMLDWLTT